MEADDQRGPRWLSGTGAMVRRASLPGLKEAARRAPASVRGLRQPHRAAAGVGGGVSHPYQRLQDGDAVLYVVRTHDSDGRDAYRVTGWCGDLGVRSASRSPRLSAPGVGLGNVRGDGEYPADILRGIHLWSHNQPELGQWFNRIRARHGAALRLLVWDDTGYELPWELFLLPADPGRDQREAWLGAQVVLSRWTTVHDTRYDLPRERTDCRGRVLGYLHHEMADDGRVFRPYAHQLHVRMTPFLQTLDTPGEPTGLVYMGCHGTYGDSVPRLTLGNRTWAELEGQTMGALGVDRSLVCLNACHSGRAVLNSAQGEHALRGFAELFLRKGAGGCIVTAGQVGDKDARALVRGLVEEVARHPHRPVTRTLLSYRARAAEAFGPPSAIPPIRDDDGKVDETGQKRILRLLYAFMFHYYGHPLTTLRLTAREGEAR
ncbi:CHAT domain-containing protein [Streptomyces sp. NBC_00620]|uniref:CHAT domain-containing protein n=1 Tax=Streptomyces sp. NBC_00620 TaxID=2903666 RepID=UPI002258C75B|nr:CHAT domain-containing protein [Streptomyces sp. NBC_00620]MCX4971458.1 CHAT domain-containing protein [Streptomyces sp. NBC_00620]